jgi:cation:H+ antiporter
MTLAWARLIAGGLLVYLGAEWFVAGASALALALRVPQLIVGLTVVAYGTSAPEAIVGIQAARAGHGAVALGNVLGSNIANIGLILGLTALVRPIRVEGSLRRRELPVLALSTLLVFGLLWDGMVARWEAGLLVVLACAYSAWMIHTSRRSGAMPAQAAVLESMPAARAPVKRTYVLRASLKATIGLLVLLAGGSWFVDGAVAIARGLGISERIVGLTIVAIGTSLPELVTSLVAARKGHADLALGNVIGSNIFNVLLCLGSAALVGRVGAPMAAIAPDLTALAFMTLLAIVYVRGPRSITRMEGALALACYLAVMAVAIVRG